MRFRRCLIVVFGLLVLSPCYAGIEETSNVAQQVNTTESDTGIIERWLRMVTEIQSEQPGWVTPLVTITPRLEQELEM